MNPGDFVIQMQPSPRTQLEVITGENDPGKSQRRSGITRLTVDVPSARAPSETRPPRWRTLEFLLYYIILVTVVPWMVYVPIQLSASASFSVSASRRLTEAVSYSETHPNYSLYRHRLATGWFPGTEIVSVASCVRDSSEPSCSTVSHDLHFLRRFPTPYLDTIGVLPTHRGRI